MFIPGLYFISKCDTAFERIWLYSPLNAITNGNGCVQYFFVVSGFLITMYVYKNNELKRELPQILGKYLKYLKIVVPAILFAFILMKCGLMFHLKAAEINSELAFVKDYNNFNPNVFNLFSDAFIMTFIKGSSYVGPLWTIRYELLGSILISMIANYTYQCRQNSHLIYVFTAILIVPVCQNLCAFIFGAFVYDLYCRLDTDNTRFIKVIKALTNSKAIKAAALVIGLYLACINGSFSGMWAWMANPFGGDTVIRAAGVTIILYIVITSTTLKKIFSLKFFVWLGNLSAYIYIFHWPVILSLGCFMYVALYKYIEYYRLVALISVSCILATITISRLYLLLLPKFNSLYGWAKSKLARI